MPYVCHVWLELQPQQTTPRAVAVGQAAPESTFANEPGNDHRCGGEPALCLLLYASAVQGGKKFWFVWLLPPFQIIRHSNNVGELKFFMFDQIYIIE